MATALPRRGARTIAAVLLAGLVAVLLPYLVGGPDGAVVAAQTATQLVMAGFLIAGLRCGGPLWRCQAFMLLAMASALVSALFRLAWHLTTGDLPTSVWQADVLDMLWMPLVVGALLSLPSRESRRGFRLRVLADGLLAASSLWYLLLGLGVVKALANAQLTATHRAQLLTNPIGDVFVIAAALTVYAHCRSAQRRLVGWTLAGLTAIACGDVLFAIPDHGKMASPSSPAGMANEVGILLLVLAAASLRRAVPTTDSLLDRRSRSVAGALPFAPLVGCVFLTSRMILVGNGMPQSQVLPALCVALALMARQYGGARDKERLVQELRARERDLVAEVRRDALTGLGNRTDLVERLVAALADPAQWPVSVALLDLNDFKLINDNHGHETGDAVLVEVAARLRAVLRQDDVVARLGGDEFAVVASRVGDEGAALGRRLLDAFNEPVHVGGQTFSVRASVGLVNGQEGETAAVALACADVAMYEAKDRRGRASALEVLTSDGRARAERRLRIQEAVSDPQLAQFSIAYQPVVSLRSGQIHGMEALLRWTHPELGTVPPDVFIPLAERAGTIGVLGDFALTTALRDLAQVQAFTPRQLSVGVNVSPGQLLDLEFASRTLGHVRRHGLAPGQLNIEITEQAFEANLDAVAASVNALTAGGVSVAVDDFGTGYSSLQYLQRLPVDIMKIDRSFVSEAVDSPRARLLLASLVSMASVLDLQLIAEGIETQEQLEFLREMGCELGQGYLFSRPVPLAELREIVLTGTAAEWPPPVLAPAHDQVLSRRL